MGSSQGCVGAGRGVDRHGLEVILRGPECLAEVLKLQAGNGKLVKGVCVCVQRNNIRDDSQEG